MSPDIEWQVDSSSGQETIAKTPPPKPAPRWRKIAVVLIIFLGVGLGVTYHLIPEPSKPLTPTPLPTPTLPPPPPFEATIDREARALANGKLQDYLAVQDPDDAQWRQHQLITFATWGKPATGSLYTILEMGMLPNDRVWADVIQFRDDEYFRQTRFYQLRHNQWLRIAPVSDASFWGSTQTLQTLHFSLTFSAKDERLAQVAVQQWEDFYTRLCSDLGCEDGKPAPALKFQMQLWPGNIEPAMDWQNDQISITLSSPRVTGLYFQTLRGNEPGRKPPLEPAVYNDFLYLIARASTGGLPIWPQDAASEQFLRAIVRWESNRINGEPQQNLVYQPEQLASKDLIDLESLWAWAPTYTQQTINLMWTESTALIQFTGEKYGADKVVEFLHTLGLAGSLPQVIDRIGLPYQKFKQDWREWLKQFAAK